ncbi:MAG: tRNA (adenosine(37)-N6)-dimethylallyltransferase MiaA [Bryobacteraceae bacterium]|nr:tRNA (adenosine(37)-N6)-dimethylallyltransferase MiaA [Bryobacteraceae bacterium]
MERPLVAVVGPTGSGKSSLSLALAASLDGEIVNCDSLQVYRWFNIGTAKLSESERLGVPHHLIDVLNPEEVFTAGEYARRAAAVIKGISARGKLPIVAGGTGFYLKALLDGLSPAPQRDEALRRRLSRRSPEFLHRLLRRWDPEAAGRIHFNDRNKLVRALEVCLLARRPVSDVQRQKRQPLEGFRVLQIGLDPPRAELRNVIDTRVQEMFASGLVEEVRGILARGCTGEEKPFEAIGYRQALGVVRGTLSVAEAIESAQIETRQYAKRQMTWFRREKDVRWLAGFGSRPETRQTGVRLVHDWEKHFTPNT